MLEIFYPLEQLYKFLYLAICDITGNYGISLIILSLLIYIILFPFNRKAQRIQNDERDVEGIIAPQISEIKKQYHGKEQYEKLQRLYHRYAYHPIFSIRSAAGIVLQIPFFIAARSMLYALPDIKGMQWGIIQNLGEPDQLLAGINLLPFVMLFVTILYACIMPKLSKKEIIQTIIIGFIFLIVLYPAPSALLIFWTCNLLWSLLHCFLFERLQWINEYVDRVSDFITENGLAFHIFFVLAVTVGLFVPLEVYIKNADQLWFSFKEVLIYFFANTSKFFAVLLLIYIICWRKTIRRVYLSGLLGLLLGVFLQAYIIEMNYGLFDGHEIKWNEYTSAGILNSLVWIGCFWVGFTTVKNKKTGHFIKLITFSIVVLQCVALLLTFKTNPLPFEAYQRRTSINVLTTKDLFTISSKENVIVFLLDAFEANIFEEMMNKEPQIIDELRGFTFYPDTTSVYGFTHNSVPQILTGRTYYNDMPHTKYLEEAWAGNQYYQKLASNHYDVGIYTSQIITSGHAPIGNLISEEVELNENSMQGFTNLIRFRMMPHFFKQAFYLYDPNGTVSLLKNQKIQVYKVDDGNFYSELKKGLTYTDNINCFRFYHLEGAHYPYIYNRNMEFGLHEKNDRNRYEQSVGVLKIVIEYIRQMKEKGIFDDSTFVIMADHGDFNQPGSRPLLCFKQPGSKIEGMKISDDSISYSEFLPMLFQRFDDNYDNGSQRNFSLPVRKYYLQQERDFVEYEIVGNAKDIKSWKKGKVLGSWYKKQDNTYELGELVDCTVNNPKFEMYQGDGWMEKPEPKGSWTVGSESELVFRIKDYHNQNLRFDFTAFAYLSELPYRTVKIFVNNQFVKELIFDNKRLNHSFKIPSSMLEGNLLKVRFIIDHCGLSNRDGWLNDCGVLFHDLRIEVDN